MLHQKRSSPGRQIAQPTCWARGLLDIVDYGVRRGAQRAALLARIPVDLAALQDPDQRVTLDAYFTAVEIVADTLADPFFGLNYIETIEPTAIDAIGFLGMASQTVGEALGRIIRYHRLMSEGEVFALEIDRGRACFRFIPYGPPRPAHAHITEMHAADCLILIPRVTCAPIEILSFRVTHTARGDSAEYIRRFGRIPEFGAASNEWSFPAAVLDRPMPQPDPGLVRFFEQYLDKKLHAFTNEESLPEEVRRLLCEGLPDRAISLKTIAQHLKMSERTLQRRLSAEYTSLESLREEVRRARALAYLRMGMPAAEVSYLLGYAEPAAFHRAFKRWTGTTPRGWRAYGWPES